eukprot:1748360-Amphidinium_carterae.1
MHPEVVANCDKIWEFGKPTGPSLKTTSKGFSHMVLGKTICKNRDCSLYARKDVATPCCESCQPFALLGHVVQWSTMR